jgi:hypothetical protein
VRTAVYPGSFDPLTIAHVGLAEAAIAELGLSRVDLCLSEDPLGKPHLAATVAERAARLAAALGGRSRLRVTTTPHRLVADIATGYDVVVLGADKWAQVLDPAWYGGGADERDGALGRLPLVAVAGRAGSVAPEVRVDGVRVHLLSLPAHLAEVSSTGVRDGRSDWSAESGAAGSATPDGFSAPG